MLLSCRSRQNRSREVKVVLLEDVPSLGQSGEVVSVRDGYGRNFLFPRKLALLCTPANLHVLEMKKKQHQVQARREKQKYQELAKRVNELSCTINVQAGEDEKLFGSVTNQDIQQALAQEGIELDKRKIELAEPIRKLGVYHVPVRLHPDIQAQLKVWVVQR